MKSVCVCRIRLSEGFHFAASGEGIVSMVMELPMRVQEDQLLLFPILLLLPFPFFFLFFYPFLFLFPTVTVLLHLCFQGMSAVEADRESHSCIVQYILFPPHSASMKDR